MHSINRRSVFAMRCVGGGRSDCELKTFCGIMNLLPPVHKTTHHVINQNLENAAAQVQDTSMSTAERQEYSLAEPAEGTDVPPSDASSDSTWMTRGHTSNIGVAITIGCVTGKVLDTGSRSKICKSCEVWEKKREREQQKRIKIVSVIAMACTAKVKSFAPG